MSDDVTHFAALAEALKARLASRERALEVLSEHADAPRWVRTHARRELATPTGIPCATKDCEQKVTYPTLYCEPCLRTMATEQREDE